MVGLSEPREIITYQSPCSSFLLWPYKAGARQGPWRVGCRAGRQQDCEWSRLSEPMQPRSAEPGMLRPIKPPGASKECLRSGERGILVVTRRYHITTVQCPGNARPGYSTKWIQIYIDRQQKTGAAGGYSSAPILFVCSEIIRE